MATKFAKDQMVRLNAVVPQGPVQAFHMNSEGEVFYLLCWTDADGSQHERWFAEDALVAVKE